MLTPNKADVAEIERALRALHGDAVPFEIRALECGFDKTISGYFDSCAAAAKAVAQLDDRAIASAIYVTVNPVLPALMARGANRLVTRAKKTTADAEIVGRRWLLVDLDPDRPVGISASDAEKKLARLRATDIKTYLCDIMGWSPPIEADSGNGSHLLLPCHLPNDDASRILIEKVLRALASRFSGEGVTIDVSVGNAARLTKAYGTMTRKGDNLRDRPHRRSGITRIPTEPVRPVTREQLEHVALPAPKAVRAKNALSATIDLSGWLEKHGISVVRTKPLGTGTLYALSACPFSPDHEDGAFAIQFASGAIDAGCHHARCHGKTWRDLRLMFEPEAHTKIERNNMAAATEDAVGAGQPRLRLVNLDTVTPKQVEWLWPKRIPLGKITMLVGDPGGGKTFVTLAIASALTRGRRLPDDPRELAAPAQVLILNFEDGTGDTIRPRAELAGCDLSRTIVIEGVAEHDRQFPFAAHHLNLLDDELERMPDVRLLVIDPIAQLLGGVNTAKDNEVRTALQPLKELAERRKLAVVCIVHLRKAEAEKALYRVSGSVAFVGFARSVLLVAEDETGRRSISRIKGNLSKEPDPVEFAIDDEGVFAWRGTAPELSAENMLSPVKREKANELSEFLRGVLAGGPLLATELYRLGEERGYSPDKLKRARKACGIEIWKEASFGGRWFCSLASERHLHAVPHSSHPSHPSEVAAHRDGDADDAEIWTADEERMPLPKEG